MDSIQWNQKGTNSRLFPSLKQHSLPVSEALAKILQEDGSNCSIFSFEINDSTRSRLPLAKNAVRKLRTLRHPGVVRIIDTVETDSYIYIATERVVPLSWHVRRDALNVETIKWGLYSTAVSSHLLL